MSSRIWHNRILEVMADMDDISPTIGNIQDAILEKYEGSSTSKHRIVWARDDLVKEGKLKWTESGRYYLPDVEKLATIAEPVSNHQFKGPLADFMYLVAIFKETLKGELMNTIKLAGTEEIGSEMVAINKVIGTCNRIIKSYTANNMVFVLDIEEIFNVLRKKVESYNASVDDGML